MLMRDDNETDDTRFKSTKVMMKEEPGEMNRRCSDMNHKQANTGKPIKKVAKKRRTPNKKNEYFM